MKAIRVHQTGGPEVMQLDEIPTPEPRRRRRAGRDRGDRPQLHRRVFSDRPLQGAAAAARSASRRRAPCARSGTASTGVAVGDRVAWTGIPGAYAEMAVVPATRLVKLPATLSFRDGAAAMLQGMTAHYLACSTYPLKPGDTCLVHAAAGGVGLLLCQVAKRRGATRHRDRLDRSQGRARPRRRRRPRDPLLAGGLRRRRPERDRAAPGVHVVYDGVGATTFEKSLDSLRPRGMLVLFGAASGPVPPFDLGQLTAKGSLFVTRPTLFHYILGDAELRARATDVLGWIAAGELKLRIEEDYPLARAADAHRALEGTEDDGEGAARSRERYFQSLTAVLVTQFGDSRDPHARYSPRCRARCVRIPQLLTFDTRQAAPAKAAGLTVPRLCRSA